MANSAIPALIDALYTQAKAALPDVLVFDGFGITEDPNDFLMVGVDDPDPQSAGLTASAEREQARMGPNGPASYKETGTFTLAAYSFNGDQDQKAARDAVHAICDAVDNLIRSTSVSGVTSSVLGVNGVLQMYVASTALQQGVWQSADALYVFTVQFLAFI